MLVYRDTERNVPQALAKLELSSALARACDDAGRLRLLLLAGEIETTLADAGSEGLERAGRLTDACARVWLERQVRGEHELAQHIERLSLPAWLSLRRPEGYAYYALDPWSYADAVRLRGPERRTAVVGIRSIGTSLSAVVQAALRGRGEASARITVRPSGHPWDRRCELEASAARFVDVWKDASFLVVDEGPGLSGSSFLAVAESLERAGVCPARIELLTSHCVNPEALRAPAASARWRRFKTTAVPEAAPPHAAMDAGAGRWRSVVYAREAEYPASWTSMERRKYILPGPSQLLKFTGFPPYGDAARARGQILAEAGFCPPSSIFAPGYDAHAWCPGAPLSARARRARALPRMVDYLAFRHRALRAPNAAPGALTRMLHVNTEEALGVVMPSALSCAVERPVYADGRMLPHEWIAAPRGDLVKVDAVDHGDDHLLPGPCDSAWDLAGVVVEWRLCRSATSSVLDRYRSLTGDDVTARLAPYVLAYAAFRWGCCAIALMSADRGERPRLERQRDEYARALGRLLQEARVTNGAGTRCTTAERGTRRESSGASGSSSGR